MKNNKLLNWSNIELNKNSYQFGKLHIRKAKGDNFISNFQVKKLEIQNRTRELLLSGSITFCDNKNNFKQESHVNQESQLVYQLNMSELKDKTNNYTCKASGLNNTPKKKLFEINDEVKRKRLKLLKNKITLINENRQSKDSFLINNRPAKTLKSSHSDSLFLTKVSNNNSPFQSTANYIQFSKKISCLSSDMNFKPKIKSKEFKQMIENNLQQSLESNSMLRDYRETQRKYVYNIKTRNIGYDKQKRTQPIDCHSQMNLFKDIKTGKRVVFTQGLSNLINFGDYFNRMSDVHCYNERAYIKKLYPLIQQGVNPNNYYRPLMQRNNSTKNIELKKMFKIVERSEELLNRIKLKKELLSK